MAHQTPAVPTSRRSIAYEALHGLAQEPWAARFALLRALDELSTEQVLRVLDEVAETVDGQPPRITTQLP